jgi:hypothetical protein
MPPPDIIRAALPGLALDEVHLAAQDGGQLVLDAPEVKKSRFRALLEIYQNIHVAVGPKVLP